MFFFSTYKHIIYVKQTFSTGNRKSAKNHKMLNHDKMIKKINHAVKYILTYNFKIDLM